MRVVWVLSFVLLIGATACSSGASSSANEVRVTTAETSAGQTVTSDVTTFRGGVSYHFVVENVGNLAHEMMIVEPIEAGTMDMEAIDEVALYVVEEDELSPGATVEFDFTFPEDTSGTDLEFACHIPGHYEAGMVLPIAVTS